MSAPIQLFNFNSANAVSMGASFSGTSQECKEASRISAQAIWSAGTSPVGFFIVEVSNNNSDWATINSQAISGNTGSLIYNDTCGYAYIRGSYTRTSGTGTMTVILNGKSE